MDYTLVLVMSDGGHQSIECATMTDVENHMIDILRRRTRPAVDQFGIPPIQFASFTVIINTPN